METSDLTKIQRQLSIVFASYVLVSLVLVILGETDIISVGLLSEQTIVEYYTAIVMELLTICIIPISLKLFHFKFVARKLTSFKQMQPWAICRLTMLGLPMVVNTVLYYLFYNVAFGYMGIILFLSMLFIVPSRQRCIDECQSEATEHE